MNYIRLFAMLLFVLTAIAAMAMRSVVYAEDSADPSHFTYGRLYCTPDGESHFQNVTVELRKMNFAPPASPINVGGNSAAASAFFAGFEPHWGTEDLQKRLNHPTPAVQFLTVWAASSRSLRPTARRDNFTSVRCFGWKTRHRARGTSRSWATGRDSSCLRDSEINGWRSGVAKDR